MSNHTKGPWHEYIPFIDGKYDETYRTIRAGIGFFDKEKGGFALTGFISEADARLIVAAPDMLEALLLADCQCSIAERLSGHLAGCHMPVVLETIAKARGEA